MKVKLSDAILAGAKLRPQGRCGYFVYNEAHELCSCAIGAALEAVGVVADPDTDENSWAYFPELTTMVQGRQLNGQILGWNDSQGLSREEIASKLAGMGF